MKPSIFYYLLSHAAILDYSNWWIVLIHPYIVQFLYFIFFIKQNHLSKLSLELYHWCFPYFVYPKSWHWGKPWALEFNIWIHFLILHTTSLVLICVWWLVGNYISKEKDYFVTNVILMLILTMQRMDGIYPLPHDLPNQLPNPWNTTWIPLIFHRLIF